MKSGISVPLSILLIIIIVACGCTGQVTPVKENPLTTVGPGTDAIPQGKGQFVFNDSLGNRDRPIVVYTYRPAVWNSSGPVLIVMHGAGREGQSPRETWIPYAEQYSSLLVVPEFSEKYYPGDQWYIGGNMFSSVGKVNPKSNWTYTAIEHLFDDIKNRTGARQNTYLLFGHSAGAQFVHRLVTFLPEARYSSAVAANAGFYIFPALLTSSKKESPKDLRYGGSLDRICN